MHDVRVEVTPRLDGQAVDVRGNVVKARLLQDLNLNVARVRSICGFVVRSPMDAATLGERVDDLFVDPIIETVSDGLFLEFMGGPVSRTKFEVDISVVHSDVTEPIPTLKTQLGTPPVEVTIQLPEVQRTRLSGQFALAQDEMLVIANERPDVASAGAQQDIVLFLSAEPIREPLPVPVDVVVPYHVMTPDGAIHEMTSKGPITAAEAVSLFSSVPRELSAVSVLRVIEGQHQLLRIDVRAIFEAGDSTSNLRLESGDVVLLR